MKTDFPGLGALQPSAVAPLHAADTCKACRYWLGATAQKNPQTGELVSLCRRYPPTIVVLPVPVPVDPRTILQNPANAGRQQMIPQPMPVRSATSETDWCGEFERLAP